MRCAKCNFRLKKDKKEPSARDGSAVRHCWFVGSWKRVRRACGVKVRPRRVWTKCAVCYGSAGTCTTDSRHIFLALLLPPQHPVSLVRSLSLFRRTAVLICPRARDTRRDRKGAAKVEIDISAIENERLLNFRIVSTLVCRKKRNHCVLISSIIHFEPEFCDNSCDY